MTSSFHIYSSISFLLSYALCTMRVGSNFRTQEFRKHYFCLLLLFFIFSIIRNVDIIVIYSTEPYILPLSSLYHTRNRQSLIDCAGARFDLKMIIITWLIAVYVYLVCLPVEATWCDTWDVPIIILPTDDKYSTENLPKEIFWYKDIIDMTSNSTNGCWVLDTENLSSQSKEEPVVELKKSV